MYARVYMDVEASGIRWQMGVHGCVGEYVYVD